MSENDYQRPSWDEYFLGIMEKVGTRTTCDRARKYGGGCVIVKDKQILVTGYVGSPPGIAHCDEIGHEFKKTVHDDGHTSEHCVRTTHSEQNAVCQAAKRGIALDGATLYCFMTPCYTCAKLVVTAGVKRIVVCQDYHAGEDSKRIFAESGIEFDILNKEIAKYDRQ
ncbi:MAG: cell division protein DedD [Candidatus Magasanikbacteria bacterium CG_4_10_14_0_2_um_filter_33_14]|uniref:Cell division protein DedD n=1 Tax=Candidatus Magasanikbacteria bacterium CG_4_10_14_0_2_um_filter_33_14 TaxID=1974636 RepID=A0A2M7VAN4_9BACT|nr:MAG: cell division protein DedD [Candidatus Magasanikbacteria bacterium CG_4_10_14_0_2_um_filter_33_14]